MRRLRTLTPNPERFRQLRLRAGFSRRGLVHRARNLYKRQIVDSHFSESTVKRIERGEAVLADALRAAAEVLGVPLAEILDAEAQVE